MTSNIHCQNINNIFIGHISRSMSLTDPSPDGYFLVLTAGNFRPRPDGLLSTRIGIWKVYSLQDEGKVWMDLPAWI